jgi:Ca-activated chloride channel family protein
MSFHWPLALLAFLVVPVLIAAYAWGGRRRRRRAVPYSSLALIKVARPAQSAWRRHIPFALILTALAALATAGARPQISTDVPVSATSVILALDVSGSMCATDVSPNRLTAAQAATRNFVKAQNSHIRIGIVVFSGFAELAVAPTTNHQELLKTIDSLTTGRGTTIGSAILKSVDAIAQINPNVAASDATPSPGSPGSGEPGGQPGATPAPGTPPGTVAYAPEIVVLLTDGANTRGVSPLEAAKVAAARGVRVYPIGFGTSNPTSMVCTADQLGGDSFQNLGPGGIPGGGVGGGGGREQRQGNFLGADEPTLRQVASTTGGTYFSASGADQLQHVLSDLPQHVQLQQRQVEISVAFAGLAALLVLLAVAAALRWSTFPA